MSIKNAEQFYINKLFSILDDLGARNNPSHRELHSEILRQYAQARDKAKAEDTRRAKKTHTIAIFLAAIKHTTGIEYGVCSSSPDGYNNVAQLTQKYYDMLENNSGDQKSPKSEKE